MTSLAQKAPEADGRGLPGASGELLHAGVGLVILLAVTSLGVYKPRGITRYGRRKQDEQRRAVQRSKQDERHPVVVP